MQRGVLSQDEIDALTRHEIGDEQADEQSPSADLMAVPYDLSTHGALAWGKIPALDGSFHTAWVDVDQNWTSSLRRGLLRTDTEVAVELGATEIRLGELLRLRPGSIIELGSKVGDPLQVIVNGKKIGEGEAVMVKRHFGIRMLAVLNREDRIQQLRTQP